MSEPTITVQEPGELPGVDHDRLEAIAGSKVADVIDALDGLTILELERLLEIEQASGARTTALNAIQREIDSRASGADNEPAGPSYTPPGDATNFRDQPQSAVDPSNLTGPVLTRDGYVCPLPAAVPQG